MTWSFYHPSALYCLFLYISKCMLIIFIVNRKNLTRCALFSFQLSILLMWAVRRRVSWNYTLQSPLYPEWPRSSHFNCENSLSVHILLTTLKTNPIQNVCVFKLSDMLLLYLLKPQILKISLKSSALDGLSQIGWVVVYLTIRLLCTKQMCFYFGTQAYYSYSNFEITCDINLL